MKKILVIYFTQSGQLNKAVKATLAPFENAKDVEVHYEEIKPAKPFPFPWSYMEFFDAFPESVHGIPCELQPFKFNPNDNYDLVIIAYQPWFLSVSIPINSFLQTTEAKQLLKNKNVITILACRNMWLNAQEKMKLHLKFLGANLIGNITYVDKAANLVSLITVLAFALKGVEGKVWGILPKYGVSEKELNERAPVLGDIVLKHMVVSNYNGMQQELNDSGAMNIKSNLLLMEGRGKALFPLYANYISKKGPSGSKSRRTRVRIFGIVLPTAILILSPIITIVSRLAPLLFSSKFKKEKEYYSNNLLK
jgi:hypothetical protein